MTAPIPIDAAHDRTANRLVCIYSLCVDPENLLLDGQPPGSLLPLARFDENFGGARPCLGLVAGPRLEGVAVATENGTILLEADAWVFGVVVPESGAILVLSLDFEGDLPETIAVLQQTLLSRKTVILGETPLRQIAKAELGAPFAADLDRDVHQVLVPGIALGEALGAADGGDFVFDPASVMRLVYREDRVFRPRVGSIAWPGELNRPASTVCGHGRGVTCIAGAAAHVEWAVVLVACELVSALSRLRDIRVDAIDALSDAKAVPIGTNRRAIARERRSQAALSRRLGDLEVQLSFGVETYIDTLHVPEIVLQSYRDSLATTLGLAEGASRTATMLERLKAILDARRDELAELQGRLDDDAKRAWAVTLLYVTVFAIPFGTWVVGADKSSWLLVLAGLGAAAVFCLWRFWPQSLRFGGSE